MKVEAQLSNFKNKRMTVTDHWSLALAYGQAHANRCLGLALRGIFLCRKTEIDWFMNGMRRIFPEAWEAFANFLPEQERADLLGNYHRRLIDPNPEIHLPAARVWSRYEGSCSTLRPNPEALSSLLEPTAALGLARIEAHYFVNKCFMQEGQLLDKVSQLARIPCIIVQGRYDAVCPIVSAVELAAAWPNAELQIVTDAGHSAMEPGIRSKLIAAMERFKSIEC